MKTISTLAVEGLNLERLLQEAAEKEAVFLTVGGEIRFALLPTDEGDQEACALRSSAEFMAYLTECEERARTRPRMTLEQVRELFGIPAPGDNGPATTP